jgi:hypothetical protein
MEHVVVLCLTTRYDGVERICATDADAQAAIDQFGQATSVERVDDERGARYLVTCSEQRGTRGAYRLHAIACDYRVPVHVQ